MLQTAMQTLAARYLERIRNRKSVNRRKILHQTHLPRPFPTAVRAKLPWHTTSNAITGGMHTPNWSPIPGYPHYEASTDGQIRSLERTILSTKRKTTTFPLQSLDPSGRKKGKVSGC